MVDEYVGYLVTASARGELLPIKLLLRAGVDPNMTTSDSLPPLLQAAANKHPACIKLMLEYGANPGCGALYEDRTPISEAPTHVETSHVCAAVPCGAR